MDSNAVGNLERFGRVLSAFKDRTSPTVPAQLLQAFSAVARDEGRPLSHYANMLGTNLSTASRQFLALAYRELPQEAGFALIEARSIPHDLRQKGFWLTEKGQQLRDDILGILNA